MLAVHSFLHMILTKTTHLFENQPFAAAITNISIVHVTYDSPIPEYVSHRCARLKTHQQTVAAERRKERPPVVRLSCVLIG